MLPGTFLKGKELWGHIDGSTKEAIVADRAAWAAKDNQIMTWILVSMEPHLILSLHPHKSANAMWDYLTQFYNQNNNARTKVSAEELINTQNIMEHTRVTSNNVSIAYAAYSKGKGKGRDLSTTQCYTSAATTTPAAALQPTAPPLTRESVREMIVQEFFSTWTSSFSSIQIANGSDLPIAAVGDVSSSFKDVLVSPNLS
ncbi:hypothetical protein ZIOFF_070008 [Zingiber officinale]|uniref:Uncharacterized protein n=1 Tax=Zingiber officinale TaxID=94328 RepID=A0A8J5CCG9_ZINOF|nr:hypothetical protein ZIOFF_070008 [Zingiber officinale]